MTQNQVKLKKPCDNCPFRSDKPFLGLRLSKAKAITESIMSKDQAFHCHKTTRNTSITPNSKLCVGAALFLERTLPDGLRQNLAFRIGEMCGELTQDELSKEIPVYDSAEAFWKGTSYEAHWEF